MRILFARLLFLGVVAHYAGAVAAQTGNSQVADEKWMPVVENPAFPHGGGPGVLVDAAHGNFHTIDGRFATFARLLELDGYKVASAESAVTAALLEAASVYVVSNAHKGGATAEWILPTPPAFAPDEIETIVAWVRKGGSLLLIADHMPFPGATADLANEFGIIFLNGFARPSLVEGGTLSFTRESGGLADHAITRGRTDSESIDSVTSFAGQAFRYASAAQPLMYIPDDWLVLLPREAWKFDAGTPLVSARGLVQGAVLTFGAGRVAVFGEAAMFTAQAATRDGVVYPMGMNHPSAADNAQFVLNVVHWLTGILGE